jgi:hypothetical protein
MFRRILSITLLLGIVGLAPRGENKPLIVSYSSFAGTGAVWIARISGFEKYGLDVNS